MVKPLVFKGDKKSKKRKHDKPETADLKIETSINLIPSTQPVPVTHEDDSWVTAELATDMTGPVIIILPTASASCIACDANGKVFTSEIKNIIEGDVATAEPHDVRQVWVANRVVGTEYASFKGHHER